MCCFWDGILGVWDGVIGIGGLPSDDRVDIWRDRCDRRSCKILVSRVNFSEKNANCVEILPGNMINGSFVNIDGSAAF